MFDDEKGIFDGIIPDLTGDDKADLLDALILNEILRDDEEEQKEEKTNNKKKKKAK